MKEFVVVRSALKVIIAMLFLTGVTLAWAETWTAQGSEWTHPLGLSIQKPAGTQVTANGNGLDIRASKAGGFVISVYATSSKAKAEKGVTVLRDGISQTWKIQWGSSQQEQLGEYVMYFYEAFGTQKEVRRKIRVGHISNGLKYLAFLFVCSPDEEPKVIETLATVKFP